MKQNTSEYERRLTADQVTPSGMATSWVPKKELRYQKLRKDKTANEKDASVVVIEGTYLQAAWPTPLVHRYTCPHRRAGPG